MGSVTASRITRRLPQFKKMNLMLKRKKSRLKAVEKQIAALQAAYPGIDFTNVEVRRAYSKFHELIIEQIGLQLDIKFCGNDNRKQMCSSCSCWKVGANRVLGA